MIYDKYCSRCKKETQHRVLKIHRNKGARLMCLLCFHINSRYINVKDLREVK